MSSPSSPSSPTGSVVSTTQISDAVGKLLVRRARMTHVKSSSCLSDISEISSGCNTPKMRPNASVEDCVELCRLLLEKVGADSRANNCAELDRVLTTEYPPGVADILGRITGALDTQGVLESVSDVSDSDDDRLVLPVAVRSQAYTPPSTPEIAYKAETEIAISRIFDLGKFSSVQDPSIPKHAPYNGPDVITMSGFGELGRFGNQVLQYAFLKAYAHMHNISEIQVPAWVGARLFDLNDAPVARALPSAVEFAGTLANSTFTDELIAYVKRAEGDRVTPELNPNILEPSSIGSAPRNVDIWGWFQWHSSVFAPFKTLLRDTFSPTPALSDHLRSKFEYGARFRGGRRRTVVGIHLRRGDYESIAASSFGYCAPTSWYLEWLERIWPTLDNPVLVVTSDQLSAVIGDFEAYNPLTTNDIGMSMPPEFKGAKAGFFPDWYALTQCDVLGISNSTFSFSASLMNGQEGLRVYRAHYADRMVEIAPWDAEPIVHRDMNKNMVGHTLDTLKIIYNTQGTKAILRNVLYELPYYGIRSLVMKAVLWRESRNKMLAATA